MTIKIVGFEGPSLGGKSTLIRMLQSRFGERRIPTIHIQEFTSIAGGHENFPPIVSRSRAEAVRAARYFLALEAERKRQIDSWSRIIGVLGDGVALVDRLIFTCMAVARAVKDDAGFEIYTAALRAKEVIMPHRTLFVERRCSDDELARRMQGRVLFGNWETAYNPPGYLDLLREIDEEMKINLSVTTSDDVEVVEGLILSNG